MLLCKLTIIAPSVFRAMTVVISVSGIASQSRTSSCLVTSGPCWLLMRSGILRKGLPALWQSNTAMEAQYRGESPFVPLYVSFLLDGISLTLPPLCPSGTRRHTASVVPFVESDSSFVPLRCIFAALRCRDLTGSSLAKSFLCRIYIPNYHVCA